MKCILGFEHGGDISKNDEERSTILTGKYPASLLRAISDQISVYTNLCEPCIVGNTHTPLLRIVNVDAKQFEYGRTIVKRFPTINYVKKSLITEFRLTNIRMMLKTFFCTVFILLFSIKLIRPDRFGTGVSEFICVLY